jgi:hypothetical protein
MNQRLEISKLAQLRAKTNRQLVQVINKRLDQGLDVARRTGDLAQAERARTEARTLVPLVAGTERLVLEIKLAQLDAEVRSRVGVRVRAAC